MPQGLLGATIGTIGGAQAPGVLGKQHDLLISTFHGAKYAQAYGGNLFRGANPSGVTTSVGLATTYVGLCLSNPAASVKNLIIRRVAGGFIVAPSTVTAINLITGFAVSGITAHTTALSVYPGLVGSGTTGSGLLDSACTLVGAGGNAPAFVRPLAETPIATTLPFFSEDLEGAIVLAPGAFCAIGTTIAGPASGFMGSFEWEEAPI